MTPLALQADHRRRSSVHTFVHRYELDTSAPTFGSACRDLARRAVLPAVVWWLAVVGIGLLIVGPLHDLPAESAVNEWFAGQRTATLNNVTLALSDIGMTESIIGACVLFVALFWWRTKQWWVAVVPAIAIGMQAILFLTSSLLVGRERPEVELLDNSPPTTAFPSGHTSASTAFYVTLAMMCQRITRPWLRWGLTVLCLLVPFLVGTARLYRGMHHLTDVLVGMANGLVCAFLAWRYLRRDV
ncbi:phosphatase PAP2 family protein [Cellulomonas sp.]|uniref:phosphatase PAP2 family protein n=1 Tax=Cellulomonas sp. TaxID=40001 RepID=UPI0025C06597|nr:phosphatase PAP2 family protein [Cellulomonas sp.]